MTFVAAIAAAQPPEERRGLRLLRHGPAGNEQLAFIAYVQGRSWFLAQDSLKAQLIMDRC